MRTHLKIAAVAMALAGMSLAGLGAANAAVGVAFDVGNVAVGYTDGYMGTDHQYHRWAHASDAAHFRAAHADQYHGWRHDDPKHRDDH